jgi:hypothetical protein
VIVPLLVFARLSPGATAAPAQGPDVPAGELVRQTVANEVAAANAGGHYMYRLTKVTPRGSETQAIIETRDWAIGRLIQVDGSPLTPERQRKEISRLDTLRKDPRRVSALKEELHHDEQRVRRIMRALPDASEFTYAGTEVDDAGRSRVRLTFRPRSAYDPPSRELAVLTGMEGTMLLDATARRLVRVDATLIRDVDFGWGILGRLYRGGHFLLEQRDVGAGRWAITILQLDFKGRKLLLKSITIASLSRATDFRRMPDDLTLEQGLARLLTEGQTTSSR